MAADKIICHCKQVSYLDIRKAMIKGARTLDEIKEMTGAATGCGRCAGEVEKILASVCGCKGVSLETVVNAVNNGANTTDAVAEETGAGSCCGRCKVLVENVIELKR
ncbi:(2Fe-2S)-binding protein [Romboutsia sp. CE17]|uniref:(2Fe-2S)-binding protein n=1 Tax=Romboutsia sp. CE17 TaxID=2724150 RepID=UPI001442B8AE|nr:(2Fe-2S)-binding protein [Romboutsia sp. CE17]QJA08428.1 (2Fe-2S)-binding protein [Romboutsia sp. CE17]